MAGYRFLMRYYQDGDDIYLFGFSRGAYIARFLSEMLDHVGLLSKGNEELVRFVWKTFARWQQRNNGNEDAKEKERELFKFMKAFRETFSRPVRRIRFLGLFDTVNSVSKVRKTISLISPLLRGFGDILMRYSLKLPGCDGVLDFHIQHTAPLSPYATLSQSTRDAPNLDRI